MSDLNKRNLKDGGRAYLLVFLGIIAIIAFAGNLNAVAVNSLDSFYGWAAGINFAAELFLIFSLHKAWKKKDEEKKDEEKKDE
jgi:hypothetical protein